MIVQHITPLILLLFFSNAVLLSQDTDDSKAARRAELEARRQKQKDVKFDATHSKDWIAYPYQEWLSKITTQVGKSDGIGDLCWAASKAQHASNVRAVPEG